MLFNILGFNISWLGLVLYGNNFIVIALLWLAAHIYKTTRKKTELIFITLVTVIGIVIDSSLTQLGVFSFTGAATIIPFWLIVLWACFAATINHSLGFLSYSKPLQFFCGLLFPPLSYIAGANLSAVIFTYDMLTTYIILSVIWALLMVSLFILKEKIYAKERSYD